MQTRYVTLCVCCTCMSPKCQALLRGEGLMWLRTSPHWVAFALLSSKLQQLIPRSCLVLGTPPGSRKPASGGGMPIVYLFLGLHVDTYSCLFLAVVLVREVTSLRQETIPLHPQPPALTDVSRYFFFIVPLIFFWRGKGTSPASRARS